MDQTSRLFVLPDLRRDGAIALPRVVIHFAVAPRTTMTWRAPRDAEIRVHDGRLWLTRPPMPDDDWLGPGDALRIGRGERIWLSADGDVAAETTITTAYARHDDPLRRAYASLRRWLRERFRLRRRE